MYFEGGDACFGGNMKSVLLLPIFLVSTLAADPKSVNIALETSLLFDPQNANQDLAFVGNLRRFLGKIEKYLKPNNKVNRAFHGNKVFSNFLQEFGEDLLKMQNDDLKELAKHLNNEMEYQYKDTTFHRIIYGRELKNFIRNALKKYAEMRPILIKAAIKSTLEVNNSIFTDLIIFLNTLYTKKDEKEMKKILKHINKYPKNGKDLKETVKKALSFMIFDRYDKLNYTLRAKLAFEIGNLSEKVADRYKNLINTNVFNFRRNLNTNSIPKASKESLERYEKDDFVNNSERQIDIVDKTRSNINEIILNDEITVGIRSETYRTTFNDNVSTEITTQFVPRATLIFRSEDDPSVTNIVDLDDFITETVAVKNSSGTGEGIKKIF